MNVCRLLSGILVNVFKSVDFFTAIVSLKSPVVAFCVRSGVPICRAWICDVV